MLEVFDDQGELVRFICADEVSEYLGQDVVPAMVRDWKRRRLVNGYKVPGDRRIWYRLDEVKSVEGVLRRGGQGRKRRTA